jgi:hypothetical protein
MKWNGQTKAQFRHILCHVYRTPVDLEMFVVERDFCRSLAEITAEMTLRGKVYQLIQSADAQGWLDDLFAAFCEENAGNPHVEQLKAELESLSAGNGGREKSRSDRQDFDGSQERNQSQQAQTAEQPLPIELPQKDYLRLKHLLASGRWREANEQTRVILLRAVNAEENYLNDEQIQNFPCQVLKIIDRLWLQYSNGRFGFSIQKQIFDECKKDIPTFGDRVQWRIQDNWISGDRVIYSPNHAPKGHLPWGIVQVITMDNVFLDAFMDGFKVATKTLVRQDWQLQMLADFMDFGSTFLSQKDFDKEEFKRGMKHELAQEEAWWEGNRLEELKVQKLFSLLYACPNL